MELMSIFREFAQVAGPTAVAALWQGAVVAAGLAVCLQLARGMSAADRFRAWAAGFAALIALPLLPLLSKISKATHQPVEAASAARAWFELDQRWALVIAAVWIAASVWRAADLVVHALKLRKSWKDAEPLGMEVAGAEVCATRELDRPSVIGFFRPRVLIPAWLLERLSAAELEQVVLHEAEHLRRRDDWSNLLQKLMLVVFPLNPGLIWIERRLCHEREMACDDAVVRATGKPRAYAACLANLAERGLKRRREALSLGAWRRRPELVGRVHRLLKQAPSLRPATARALMALVSGGLVFGTVEFARAPQLVAFVAPVIAQSSTPDMVHADERAMAGFRAVNAVARIPGGMPQGAVNNPPRSTAAKNAVVVAEHKAADSSRGSEAGPIEVAAADSKADASAQWIVLTAWEQVMTVRRLPGVVADYSTDGADGFDQTGAEPSAGGSVQGWQVTQLILHVDSSAGTDSQMGQPQRPAVGTQVPSAEMPLKDGWLVFQL